MFETKKIQFKFFCFLRFPPYSLISSPTLDSLTLAWEFLTKELVAPLEQKDTNNDFALNFLLQKFNEIGNKQIILNFPDFAEFEVMIIIIFFFLEAFILRKSNPRKTFHTKE